MLKRIYVHNYRTFVNFEWSPPSACVLIGENGSGKSSLLDVLMDLRALLVHGMTVVELNLAAQRTKWLSEPEQKFELELAGEGKTFRYLLTVHWESERCSIRESLHMDNTLVYRSRDGRVELFDEQGMAEGTTAIPYDRQRSFVSVLESQGRQSPVATFRALVRSIVPFRPDPMRFNEVSKSDANGITMDLSNFVDFYRSRVGQDPEAAVQMMQDLREVLVGFTQIRLESISQEHKELRVRFKFAAKPHELTWAQLSPGQRLLIALYGVFRLGLSRWNDYVFDEIENYVAPKEIQPFLRKLLDAFAESGKQVIVISHHPESINYLAVDSMWRMWRDKVGGHSRIAKIEPDLAAGETAYDVAKRGETEDA